MTIPSGPGWYNDPFSSDPRSERYWDGTNWTPRRRPKRVVPSQQTQPQGWNAVPGAVAPGAQGQPPPLEGTSPYRPAETQRPQWQQQSPPVLAGGTASIVRGSPRWVVGWAILALGIVLAVSAFMEWAQMRYVIPGEDGRSSSEVSLSASVTAMKHVDVRVVSGLTSPSDIAFIEQIEKTTLSHSQSGIPGVTVVVWGVLIVAAAIIYLFTRRRTAAAIFVVVASTLALVVPILRLSDLRGMFGESAGWQISSEHVSPGFGILAALISTVALIGLGVTAIVLERRVERGLRSVPFPAG